MLLCELFESKIEKKKTPSTQPRDYYAKAVTRKTGAGAHQSKKFTRKEKHKNADSSK